MAKQQDSLLTDDSEYAAQFDVAIEAQETGNAIEVDLPAAWRGLREQGPVHKGEPRVLMDLPTYKPWVVDREIYSLLSYRACTHAARDNLTFSSDAYMDYPIFRVIGQSIINKIGPEHRNLRAVVQPLFLQPKARTWWRGNWIDMISTALLTRLEGMDRADLNLELCARMPIHTIIRGIGINPADALPFRENLLRSTGMRGGTPEQLAASPGEVRRMLRESMEVRRTQPLDDLISNMLASRYVSEDGERPLTEDEILSYCQLIILAGAATTWRQLGITIFALMQHYPFWEACRDDRSLIPQAVEEAARWHATQQVFPRIATQDTEVEGMAIPKGARVFICTGAANRDPERWERPEEYDIFRTYQAHMGFGQGAHICLGMHVAKEEMVTALNGLMDRFPNMRPDPDAPPMQVIGAMEQRGMSHVRVLLH